MTITDFMIDDMMIMIIYDMLFLKYSILVSRCLFLTIGGNLTANMLHQNDMAWEFCLPEA